MEKYKIYLGVKYVELVMRPYKTRSAFTNLASSPPTIYLNEYLIDDEEILEYLVLRELIHISISFSIFSLISSTFSFGIEVQSVVELLRVGQAADVLRAVHVEPDEPEALVTSFFSLSFYGAFRRRLVLREELLRRDNVDKGWEKRGLSACRYILTGTG